MALTWWFGAGIVLAIGWRLLAPVPPVEPMIHWAPKQMDTALAAVMYFPCTNLTYKAALITGDTVQIVWTPATYGVACTVYVERKEYVPSFTNNQ